MTKDRPGKHRPGISMETLQELLDEIHDRLQAIEEKLDGDHCPSYSPHPFDHDPDDE